MSNLNPQLANQQVYVARSQDHPDLEVTVHANSDSGAIVLALDTIGYQVIESNELGTKYVIADADDSFLVESSLTSTKIEEALREALKLIRWTISEPQELLGGSLGAGFGLEE